MLKLNNDENYTKLMDLCKMEPVVEIINKTPEEYALRITWHVEMVYAHFFARDYKAAEAEMRKALKFDESHAALNAQLADLVGRQGRYKEALEIADKAIANAKISAEQDGEWAELFTYTAAISKAAWLAASGDKDAAAEVFATVQTPSDEQLFTDFYSKSCLYYALSKQPQKLEEAMTLALKYDFVEPEKYPFGFNRACFERDAVYDPYRLEEWFTSKIGPTVLK